MIVLIALQSIGSMADTHSAHQSGVEHLEFEHAHDNTLTIDNSYQYGPVCVDKSVRGQGVFEQIFAFALEQMSRRYPFLVTFINQIN